MIDKITEYLQQGIDEQSNNEKDITRLRDMMAEQGQKSVQERVAVTN
jgi:hypothetical protein